jgi:hypothetical protein
MCRAKSDASGQAREPAGKASEPTALFPGSQCPPPSHFWQIALASPAALAPAEREHLDRCAHCREYLARVLQAVQCPEAEVGAAREEAAGPGAAAPAAAYNEPWGPARRAGEVGPRRREAGGG